MARTKWVAMKRLTMTRFWERALSMMVLCAVLMPGLASAYAGQQVMTFAATFIIAPLGLFAVVIGAAGALFRPEMVKGAVWAAVVCAFLYFLITQGGSVISSMQAG
jgi:hypothetical protein